ncbi:MAG: rhodanese-like domain-containing protein [Actinomycetia bacterium]|nr:rhodanese-like domain-containing protein [Actinomycetes bacterium]
MPVVEVEVAQLQVALANGAKLIDVREPHEYEEGHVAGSVLIPLKTVPDRVDEFRGAAATYLICRSGARSLRACEYLAQQGIEAINVAGGMLAWIDSGQPVQ